MNYRVEGRQRLVRHPSHPSQIRRHSSSQLPSGRRTDHRTDRRADRRRGRRGRGAPCRGRSRRGRTLEACRPVADRGSRERPAEARIGADDPRRHDNGGVGKQSQPAAASVYASRPEPAQISGRADERNCRCQRENHAKRAQPPLPRRITHSCSFSCSFALMISRYKVRLPARNGKSLGSSGNRA